MYMASYHLSIKFSVLKTAKIAVAFLTKRISISGNSVTSKKSNILVARYYSTICKSDIMQWNSKSNVNTGWSKKKFMIVSVAYI